MSLSLLSTQLLEQQLSASGCQGKQSKLELEHSSYKALFMNI